MLPQRHNIGLRKTFFSALVEIRAAVVSEGSLFESEKNCTPRPSKGEFCYFAGRAVKIYRLLRCLSITRNYDLAKGLPNSDGGPAVVKAFLSTKPKQLVEWRIFVEKERR